MEMAAVLSIVKQNFVSEAISKFLCKVKEDAQPSKELNINRLIGPVV